MWRTGNCKRWNLTFKWRITSVPTLFSFSTLWTCALFIKHRQNYTCLYTKLCLLSLVYCSSKLSLTFPILKYVICASPKVLSLHSPLQPQTWFQLACLSKPLHSITPLLTPVPPIPLPPEHALWLCFPVFLPSFSPTHPGMKPSLRNPR